MRSVCPWATGSPHARARGSCSHASAHHGAHCVSPQVRIPVGYWITEPPVGGSSAYEYGFSAEGFVTGGLNHLQAMLPKLRTRGITALLDVHSLPCGQACISNGRGGCMHVLTTALRPLLPRGQACISNGLSCDAPYAFASSNDSMAGVVVGAIPRCKGEHHEMEHGNYSTSRTPGAALGIVSWGDVAVESVAALARWIASLPPDLAPVIGALQLANEPALNTPGYLESVKHFYRRAIRAARAALASSWALADLPLVLNFIYPNDRGLDEFMKEVNPWGGRH